MNTEVLLKNLRTIPNFPIKGILFFDVTTLFKDPTCLKIMVDDLYEYYKDKGEKDRQEIAKQQYMEEHFIPAIEVVVNYTSPDELLNCSEALKALDKYALGVGRTAGYTAAYVRQAYGDQLGQVNGKSDAVVIDEVRRIKKLADKGEIRVAVGIASRIKKQIDNGDRMADDDDYALIGRVAAYGS